MEVRVLRKKKKKTMSEVQLFQAIEKHIETNGFPKKSLINEILLKIKMLESKIDQIEKTLIKADNLIEKASDDVNKHRAKSVRKLEMLHSDFSQ